STFAPLSLHDALPIWFKKPRGQAFSWRVYVSSVDAYLAANGPGRGVRRASKGRMAKVEKEITSLRALVEAGIPSASGVDRLAERSEEHTSELQSLAYL